MDDTFMNSLILHQYKLFHIYEIILSRDHDDLIKIRSITWSIFLCWNTMMLNEYDILKWMSILLHNW
jgi:hypothetical protein